MTVYLDWMTPKGETPIVLTVSGSRLFGTHSPTSDKDFMGVFRATTRDVVLGKAVKDRSHKTNNQKDVRNTADDVDYTAKELRTFIENCMSGQMYAYNMLFTPKDMILHTTDTWKFIQKNADKLVSRNLEPFLGYCKSQAFKYGMKGTRLDVAEKVLAQAQQYRDKFPRNKVSDFVDYLRDIDYIDGKFGDKVTVTKLKNGKAFKEHLTVLEKHFQMNRNMTYFIESVQAVVDKYSARTRKAKEDGGKDWKALSHAIRVVDEVEMLGKFGRILYPLPNAKHIKAIKYGEVDYEAVQDELMTKMEKVQEYIKNLPEQPDRKFWENWLFEQYVPTPSFVDFIYEPWGGAR